MGTTEDQAARDDLDRRWSAVDYGRLRGGTPRVYAEFVLRATWSLVSRGR